MEQKTKSDYSSWAIAYVAMRMDYCGGIYALKSLSFELGISLRFPCLRSLCKINTNENLRGLPQLNEVDDVLHKEYPK